MVRRVLAAVALVVAAAPLGSVAVVAPSALLTGLCVTTGTVAAVRPLGGLTMVVLLMPLSTMIARIGSFPVAGSVTAECLVLAFVCGWLARIIATGAPDSAGPVVAPVIAMAVVVSMSALVAAARIIPYDLPLFSGLAYEWRRWLTDFPHRSIHLHPWYSALRWMMALALVMACAVSARSGGIGGTRLVMKGLVIALTGAAALNVSYFAEQVLSSANPAVAAREYLSWLRVNVHYPDLNAAGSVFVMCALLLIGFIRTSGRVLWAPLLGLICTCAALWLVGSRTALAVFVLMLVAGGVWEAGVQLTRRHLLVTGMLGIVALAGALFILWQFPRERANIAPAQALEIRWELLKRSIRMVADHPVFGIGIGRYFEASVLYASPDVGFSHENAHNDAAQIVAELGLTGLAAFAWLLARALGALVRGRAAGVPRRFRIWWVLGIGAYLLTGTAGHPLIVFDAAVPFWVLVGLAAGLSPLEPRTHGLRHGRPVAVALLILFGWRVAGAKAATVDEGPRHQWRTAGGLEFRDAGTADTLLIRRGIREVTIPLRLGPGDGPPAADVEISVNGEVIGRARLRQDYWTMERVVVPDRDDGREGRVTLLLPDASGTGLQVGRVSAR